MAGTLSFPAGKATADSVARRLHTRSQAHVDNFWRAIEEKGRGSTGPAGRHRSELRLTTKTEFDHGRHGPGCATSKALPRNHGSSENQRGRPSNAAGPFGRL